jgi:hypothetical protein
VTASEKALELRMREVVMPSVPGTNFDRGSVLALLESRSPEEQDENHGDDQDQHHAMV